jgi:PelA/Pel-15E family pectate lyase
MLSAFVIRRICLFASFWVFAGIAESALSQIAQPSKLSNKAFPKESWSQQSPALAGLNATMLAEFGRRVGGDGCIIKDGNLVATWGDPNRCADWASAAKPVLSTLLLLAVQEGKLPGLDAKVKDVGWALSEKDAGMTFRHLANMVSGYACAEEPGSAWGYNDFAIQLYAKSLERVFGEPLENVLRTRLASLQFEDATLFGSRQGTGVTASPRDFARIGWLWLNRGNWNGKQLIATELMDDFLKAGVPMNIGRTQAKSDDYLAIGSYGGGTNQTPYGPGVYGFNLWFNNLLPNGNRVWPSLPSDTFQANGMWNRDTVTVIPSWNVVIASRGSKPGKFEPGLPNSEYDDNMRLIATAVSEQVPDQQRTASDAVELPRWQPHDFSFVTKTAIDRPFHLSFAAKVTRPDGSSFTQPGFYDGEGVWKIRVSGTMDGTWSLETVCDEPTLNQQQAQFRCIPNANPLLHGALQIDPLHPRHFRFEDGTRFYMLAYECDWLWALDTADPEIRTIERFLDRLVASGFNYVILNTYAHDTSWCPGKWSNDDYGPPPIYPWAGSNDQPDHSRLNVDYWKHYDRVIAALHRRGMIAHLFLKVYNKKVKWPDRGSNNDEMYFRSLVARYSAYSNIVWDFSKEAHNEKDWEYKRSRIELVRSEDAYHRLITHHDDNGAYDAGAFDQLVDFRCDQQHSKLRQTLLAQREKREWPIANVEFGYEQGTQGPDDKTYRVAQSPEEFVARAWEVAMTGSYTAYYYTYTAWDVIRPDHHPRGYDYFGNLRRFFESTQFHRLRPVEGFANAGWTLADPGWEYVVYIPHASAVELELPKRKNGFNAKWFHPLRGEYAPIPSLDAGFNRLTPPESWVGPAVLHILGNNLSPIDVSGFQSGRHHWRDLRGDNRFIEKEPDQPSYATTQVREIAENILSFQRTNGGWPKDYDMTAVLSQTQLKNVLGTKTRTDTSYDNGNVHSQVEYLANAYAQCELPEWRIGCERGLDFMLRSQYPNGGFPQWFPNAKSFHAHVTFNDGVMMGIMHVLRDAAQSKPHFAWLDEKRKQQASDAVARGIECILRSQIVVGGVKKGWCQQHDQSTLEPRPARAFELASLCPQDTTEIVRFLMEVPNPSPQVVESIESAVRWLKQSQLTGIRIERVQAKEEVFLRHNANFDVVVVADPGAKPLWARHYELETGKPIFAGRDGVKKYTLAEIDRDRRTGTAWYGGWPDRLLTKEYPEWLARKR